MSLTIFNQVYSDLALDFVTHRSPLGAQNLQTQKEKTTAEKLDQNPIKLLTEKQQPLR
jgi:hypothetical protein